MSNEQHKALIAAADFFTQSARKLLTVDGRLHAETLIASVARMAGSLMYRSFNFDQTIEPGTGVLSDQANIHGPKLMNDMHRQNSRNLRLESRMTALRRSSSSIAKQLQ
jgi:hypothetical protein